MSVQQPPARRPGGRSARVRAAVHHAVLDLLGDHHWAQLSLPLIAQRAGVHPATLYRRWGSLPALVDDVVTEQLARQSAVPDTGSLRGDLERYAVRAAADVAGPLGIVVLRAALVATRSDQARSHSYLARRGAQLQAMLDRAAARGEHPPTLVELLEVVLAPLYFHALFFNRPAGPDHARTLVDRLLTLTDRRHAGRPKAAGSPASSRSLGEGDSAATGVRSPREGRRGRGRR